MSSSDGDAAGPRRSAGRASLFALLAALALAACTVQPLYGTATQSGGRSVQDTMTQIAVDPVDTRVAQEVRNKLIFGLNGGAQPASPLYRLHLTVTSVDIPLGINDVDAAPSYAVSVSATYDLTLLATGALVLHGTTQGQATYDRVNQVFANVRAHVDAERRAATSVADGIRIRVAAAAAKGLAPPAGPAVATIGTPPAGTPAH